MSDNKYIIDKDSLTGIADAVRDKLGTGEATTDPQTGDIVYPEDKGYYLKQGKVAGLVYPGNKGSQTPFMNVSNETVQELCGGIVPTYIKFTVLTLASSYRAAYNYPCGLSYNGTTFYLQSKGGYNTYLQNIVGSTKTISYNSTVGCQIIGASGTYRESYQTWSYFDLPGSIKIEFLDENNNNILASIEGPISAGLSSSNYTMEIPTSIVPAKIPFSIGDIQNKITNYLIKGEKTTKAVMFFLDDSKNNEHALSVGWSGGWFINLNGSYASAALPNLRPENIQYILGYSASSSYYYYQYDPKIKALQHYTSYSESSGYSSPRIPGVTDYYFLANATQRNNGYTFGLACFDNGTDLDFQIVQKLSGSTLEGQLKTLRFTNFQPIVFFIIYKEA